jgi:hypothetical protein
VVDDGVGAMAWDLKVPAGSWRRLTRGRSCTREGAVLYADSCTVTVGIHGAGQTGDEASLIRVLSLVAMRLTGLVIRP